MDFKLIDLIYREKNFLSDNECDFLINEYESRINESVVEQSIDASSGKFVESTFKTIEILPDTKSFKIVHSATEKIINKYHDYLDSFDCFHSTFRKALNFSHKFRILKYSPGESIHPHIDHDFFCYASCTFNLNDNYEGGQFSWFKGKHSVELSKGEALIFPADYFWVHEVKPITRGFRYSVNSFLLQFPLSWKDMVHLNFLKILNNLDEYPMLKKDYSYKYKIND